jgi:type II restriction enzyme
MTDIVEKATNTVNEGILSFCRFITANDTGATGSHQSGFYIPKTSFNIFFDSPGVKGSNSEKFLKIKWQNDFITENRAIYYGQGTRNEYRLTRFGRGFPFLEDEYIGSLLIITKKTEENYEAFILSNDEDIEGFLDNFGMSPVDTNSLIEKGDQSIQGDLGTLISDFLSTLPTTFPDTTIIANEARSICTQLNNVTDVMVKLNPDQSMLNWLKTEFELFKKIEIHYYSDQLTHPFTSVDQFIEKANSILNRRKSRAGQSLEHHLDTIFKSNNLRFSHPGRTEGNRKPDFIFPGNDEYHDVEFNHDKLIFLGAKTTCKDRWRQILDEASKIPCKHLFTLQQGISKNQLDEMYESEVRLVVPLEYKSTYPVEYRDKILSLKEFMSYTREKQNS